jgi:hypothetical protein
LTRLRLFQFSLQDQASQWLERLPAGSITSWDDLTTRFLAQFFPPGRTTKLRNDILMFQQRQGETLYEAWTHFKDLLQKVPHHGIDLWLQVQIFYDHIDISTRRTIDQSAGGKLRDLSAEESWELIEDLALYDNESWNDPCDLNKKVKAISFPSNNSSTPDRRIMELEDQVKCLMKSYEAPKPLSQVNKITSSCRLCNGPHETHNCMELPKHAFKKFTLSRVDKKDREFATKQGPRNFNEAYNAWKDKPNFKGYQTRSVSFNDSPPLEWSEHFPSQNTPRQSYEDALRKFILSQELQLSTLETVFRQQQADMNDKICNLLTAIKKHVVSKPIQAKEVKSVTAMNQPTSPVKIKSPSKLFKHLSPKVKDVRDHINPPGPIHFVNTITTISAPTLLPYHPK